MRHGSARLTMAVFLLATALTLAQEDARIAKPPASMLPPAPFVETTTPKTTPSHKNVTTAPPTPHNTTTHKVTTAPPTPHNTTTHKVTTAPPTPHNTTTHKVTTAPPTPHNTTTHNVTTAPPTPHNTTTHNVTTAPPTPHNTTTPNTTTHSPTTSHTPKPEPTPTTNVTVGNYTVKNESALCIMVQAAIQVQVNNSKMAGNYNIVPGTATFNGSCEQNTASLRLTLPEGKISMNFTKNDTKNVVFVSAVALNLTYAFKSGVLSHLEKKNESVQLFSMATSHSYSCKSESVFLGDGAYLKFSQSRLQAFKFTNNQFGPIDLCNADQPDYRVAVGVAVVLIILIIIVVVAYLISRRRRTDGYQTL